MTTSRVSALALLIGLGLLVAPAPASAGGGGDAEAGSGGSCSGTATWEMKVKSDDGHLEWELEVDGNHARQLWRVRVVHDGAVIFSGKRRTKAPSGSFSVERRTADHRGVDHFVARARQLKKGSPGQLCRAGIAL